MRRVGRAQEALAIVATDRGKVEMDASASQLDVMRREENRLRQTRLDEMDAAYATALASGILSGLLGAALTAIGVHPDPAKHRALGHVRNGCSRARSGFRTR
jgi:CHASE3 domain sensor protein